MRIVTRKQFLELPNGTVYSYYEPCNFRDLNIKGESLSNDFFYDGIVGEIETTGSDDFFAKCYEMQDEGASLPMDFEQTSREGLFSDNQLFAIYEYKDVEKLIARLQSANMDILKK